MTEFDLQALFINEEFNTWWQGWKQSVSKVFEYVHNI